MLCENYSTIADAIIDAIDRNSYEYNVHEGRGYWDNEELQFDFLHGKELIVFLDVPGGGWAMYVDEEEYRLPHKLESKIDKTINDAMEEAIRTAESGFNEYIKERWDDENEYWRSRV